MSSRGSRSADPRDTDNDDLIELYRRRARFYDWTANVYYLIGYRESAYRKLAIEALELEPGQTVVEIGCGTGRNFSRLESRVGQSGRIIGVDQNDAMLARAKDRIRKRGWNNVDLEMTDASEWVFPSGVDAIVSTFALGLMPEQEEIISRGAEALSPGGRFVVLDFKMPVGAPEWLIRLGMAITAPFGVERKMLDRRPWESLDAVLEESSTRHLYAGFSYLSVGRKRTAASAGLALEDRG